jgi:hypothetical protein
MRTQCFTMRLHSSFSRAEFRFSTVTKPTVLSIPALHLTVTADRVMHSEVIWTGTTWTKLFLLSGRRLVSSVTSMYPSVPAQMLSSQLQAVLLSAVHTIRTA